MRFRRHRMSGPERRSSPADGSYTPTCVEVRMCNDPTPVPRPRQGEVRACAWCGEPVKRSDHRFCGNSCSAKWRNRLPSVREAIRLANGRKARRPAADAGTSPSDVTYRSLDFLGFPRYRVGTDGTVWSTQSGAWRQLTPSVRSVDAPYLVVGLYGDSGGAALWSVHTLVLLAFVGPRPDGMEACHFPDRDLNNNRLDNLSWGTRTVNYSHRVIHGTTNRGMHYGQGERCCHAKFKDAEVIALRRRYAEGGCTTAGLARDLQVNESTIRDIVKGRTWRHLL
jgi:hypothetical protein